MTTYSLLLAEPDVFQDIGLLASYHVEHFYGHHYTIDFWTAHPTPDQVQRGLTSFSRWSTISCYRDDVPVEFEQLPDSLRLRALRLYSKVMILPRV